MQQHDTTRRESPSLRAVRRGLSAVSKTSPELAALLGEKLMFRTTRRPAPAWERELLESGREFRIASAWGDLAAWSWGEGPTVLLVHGWNGRGSQLGKLVQPLARSGHRVVTFDAPGHGKSPGSSASILHFAGAIESAVDAVRPVFGKVRGIVAHSMGGPSTVIAMSRARSRNPIEIDRSLRDSLPVERFAFIAPPIDVRDFVRGFSKLVALGPESELLLRQRIEARFSTDLSSLYAPSLARSLSAPLLVVHDEDDREVPVSQGKRLAAAWHGSHLQITQGLGHTRILGDESVLSSVVDFVTDEARQTAA